jgi:hypothetical protein
MRIHTSIDLKRTYPLSRIVSTIEAWPSGMAGALPEQASLASTMARYGQLEASIAYPGWELVSQWWPVAVVGPWSKEISGKKEVWRWLSLSRPRR